VFTGIIEELGSVKSIQKGKDSARIIIAAPLIVSDMKLGDSIAVNGICLTVVDFNNTSFTAEVMAETLTKTNLGDLKPEVKVNLERALRLRDRLGGHLVSGHVDGVGIITGQTRYDIALVSEISYPEGIGKYLIPKGSIAIDGISLTVVNVTSTAFTVSLIPHTRGITNLGLKKVGDKVNLEADVIAKYLEKLVQPSEKTVDPGGIKVSFLSQHGFL
jgi:riboflavin synthase